MQLAVTGSAGTGYTVGTVNRITSTAAAPYLRRAPRGSRRRPPCAIAGGFLFPPKFPPTAATNADPKSKKEPEDAPVPASPKKMPVEIVHALPPPAAPPSGSGVAEPPRSSTPRSGCSVDTCATATRPLIDPMDPARKLQMFKASSAWLQGDRGRGSVRVPAGLRLHPPADRRGPDPDARHHPGPDAVAAAS